MIESNAFMIFNASAGSGKTFAVVKEYLKILIRAKNPLAFKSVLALTFTNKAVGEMKGRIIEMLRSFSDPNILKDPNSMFSILTEELDMNSEALHKKSKTILNAIVHNYTSFDVSTIDKFNHRLIKTFAYDLTLPVNFEVELDSDKVLSEAVERLIGKAGTDEELTKVLVDFAIEKADEDKSWDIAYDFNAIAKLLIDENEFPFIETIKDKSLDDFNALKKSIISRLTTLEKSIVEKADSILTLIEESGLEHTDFSRSTVPNHFKKLIALDFSKLYDNQLQNNLAEKKSIYNKTTPFEISRIIDSILPQIETSFLEIKNLVFDYKFLKNIYKNITPLSVLFEIYKTLLELKEEDNFLLISEFNSIISNEIKKQPVPFIYERIGEKFKHYFIDEFQDTSILQWTNLIPLIDNALSGETLAGERGTAMLVGDAKQAIYRWRGGKPDQFIDLFSKKETPLVIPQSVTDLPTNYRSSKNIVNFNNGFFKHLSKMVFSNPEHKNLFDYCNQLHSLEREGFIEISFLDIHNSDKDQLYCDKVLESINKSKSNGYQLGDICVITRKTKEGITIAEFLSEQGIPIVSSETLLLQNSPEVNFIINILSFALQPKNDLLKIELLTYLAEHQLQIENKHDFYSSHIHLDFESLFMALESFGLYFNLSIFVQSPLYEAVECVVRAFKINHNSNAYLQFFMDEIWEHSLKNGSDILGFLNHWEQKKEKLSIVSPDSSKAVKIMTIHKAKGLEFPVVIFPYANQDIYYEKIPKVWFPVDGNKFSGFSHVYINLNKDLEEYSELGKVIYNNHRAQLELDNINLLYVALTRAIDQIYVISEMDLDASKNENLNRYSGLFINYLKSLQVWNPNQLEYDFGKEEKNSITTKTNEMMIQSQFISTSRQDINLNILTRNGYLWDTAQEKAIERGNLIHLIMSKIKTKSDIDFAFEHFLATGVITPAQFNELEPIVKEIVYHPKLSAHFDFYQTIYNEQDIATPSGDIVRPDRVVVNVNNQASILDYKTGAESPIHQNQLEIYGKVLEGMKYHVANKILVYINEDIQVKEF